MYTKYTLNNLPIFYVTNDKMTLSSVQCILETLTHILRTAVLVEMIHNT